MRKIRTTNPETEQIIKEYDVINADQVKESTKKAKNIFDRTWSSDIKKRAQTLYDFANYFRKNKEKLAKVATTEMGKPMKESRSEIEKCAWVADFFADNGELFSKDEQINTDARKTFVSFEPLGVIGSIMPWNFPYWQALRFAAPSLMAGNTVVLKPASMTMQCGIEIENTFRNVGVPDGVFQTLIGDSTIAEALIDSEYVNAVTFTGSVPVGAKVAQRAGANIKKCVLELGGSDPFIVCDDADIEKASNGAVKGRFINCGQSCIASKRFIVVKNIADEFIEKFVSKTEKLKVGNPLSDDTDIGPMVSKAAVENISSMVEDAKRNGALVLTGGQRSECGGKGFFYKPTVITNVSSKMRVSEEEVFGPVAPITIVEEISEAIELANYTDYGLGATIWTQDIENAEKLARAIRSGVVSVNNIVSSDPRVPFGGIKNSGFGRELSRYGMMEFVNIKSVRFYDQLVNNHHVE